METRENTDRPTSLHRIARGVQLSVLCGLFLNGGNLRADDSLDSIRWWNRNPLPTGQHLLTVTAGPEAFVAAGENGLILRSAHGAFWEPVETPVFDTFSRSFFTGDEYTVAGHYSILTSPDGLFWKDVTPDFLGVGTDLIYDLDRDGDRWAALTPNAAWYSADGLSWARFSFETWHNLNTIALGPDRLVVGLNTGMVLVRRMGIDDAWIEVPLTSFGASGVSVAFGDGLYQARTDGRILTSTDGLNWTAKPLVLGQWLTHLDHTAAGWFIPDAEGPVAHSSDGHNWVQRDTGTGPVGCFDVDISPSGTWVGVGSSGLIVTSTDGVEWIRRDSGAGPSLYGMARINGRWIAGGSNGAITTSNDGIRWSTTTVGVPGDYFRPYTIGDRVYLLGTGYCADGLCTDAFYETVDGITWTKTDLIPSALKQVKLPAPFHATNPPIRIGGRWFVQATVGLTGSGAVFTSEDGNEWVRSLVNGMLILSIGGDDDVFLAGDAYGTVHVSSDLITWTAIPLTQGGSITTILGAEGLFLASSTGPGGGIFASKNGYEWERLPITRTPLLGGARVGDSFWFVGDNGTIIEVDAHRSAPLANLSVRSAQPAEAPPIIAGFVVEGTGPREVLIRAVGPGLESFGVQGMTGLPHLKVYSSEKLVAECGAWTDQPNADAIEETAARVGAFPLDRYRDDAALLLTLEPGSYTAVATGLDSGSGQPLVEVYDASGSGSVQSALVNSSNRGILAPGETMVGGFVVRGDRDRMVLIRAVGPGLARFGVANPAVNPRLTIHSADGIVAANDDWTQSADSLLAADAAVSAGAFALETGSADAALVFQAAPGNYTVHVTPADGSGGGEVLLEVYYLDR
ncbi:MAG: hypothetical protein R3F07_17090 [Opitutaceae bacterium]